MKIRIFVSNEGVLFDFDGFKGNSCIEEFEKILKVLNRAGVEARIEEMKMKTGMRNATDLRERG